MANATPVRPGQVNGAGAVDALFLKLWSGEVITAFEEMNIGLSLVETKVLTGGKSHQFPMFGKASEAYHVPGTEITGGSINKSEQIIVLDDVLYSDVFIDDLEEIKDHVDSRSAYVTELGRALSYRVDKDILRSGVLAARSTHPVTGLAGGSVVTLGAAGDELDGDKLVEAIFAAQQVLLEKDVPLDGVVAIFRPAQYNAIVNSDKAVNRDLNPEGNGSIASGKVWDVAGISIMWSNHLPSTNVTGTFNNKYDGDFSLTVGLVIRKGAVGLVQAKSVTSEVTYDPRRFGHLATARLAIGLGTLNPQNAVEIEATV